MKLLYIIQFVILIVFCSCEKKVAKLEELVSRPKFNDTSFYDVIGTKDKEYSLIRVNNFSNKIVGVGIVNTKTLVPIGEWFYLNNDGTLNDFILLNKDGKNKMLNYNNCFSPSIFLDSIGILSNGNNMLFFSFFQREDRVNKIKLLLIDEEAEKTDSIEFKSDSHPFLNVELKGKLPSHIQFKLEEVVNDTVMGHFEDIPFQLDTIKKVSLPTKVSKIYTKKVQLKEAGVTLLD